MSTAQSALSQGDFEITGAYGRDYKSRATAMADWEKNKEFKVRATGQCITRRSAKLYGLEGKTIYIRYGNGRMVFPVTV